MEKLQTQLYVPKTVKCSIALPLLAIVSLPALGSWLLLFKSISSLSFEMILVICLSLIIWIAFFYWLAMDDWIFKDGRITKRNFIKSVTINIDDVVGVGEGRIYFYGANVFEVIYYLMAILSFPNKVMYVEFKNGKRMTLIYSDEFIAAYKKILDENGKF